MNAKSTEKAANRAACDDAKPNEKAVKCAACDDANRAAYGKEAKLSVAEKASLLTGKDFWNSLSFDGYGIPSVRFSDGPTGVRTQSGKGDNLGLGSSLPATCFPTHSALACSWNRELCRGVGARIGEEASAYGADVLLAPGLNIKRNPLCGRNFEYFSEDPYLNGKLGAAYAAGTASSGTGACLKHFAANSREYARMVCDSVADERTLREIYLTGFEIAVKEAKPAAVMTAYNRLNGVYCNESEFLIKKVLRGEWGFDGIVISDWGGTADRVAAVKAGADLEMPSCALSADEICEAVGRGELDKDSVTACADRIIRLARREKEPRLRCDFNEHENFAAECAKECAVLLKNNGVLPFNGGEKIALVGELAKNTPTQGGGSSKVNSRNIDSLYDRLKDEAAGFERGYRSDGKPSGRLLRRALKLAAECDAVIFCAGSCNGDSEGADRNGLSLPVNQTEALKAVKATGKRVVVVLYGGGAVETDWDVYADALLYVGLAGDGGAKATAELLYGRANPSGKLAETFPVSLKDVPSAEYFSADPYYTLYKEGMNVGYRYFATARVAVKYPFGFGLSYTRFVYSDIEVGEDGVSFSLTNTGGMRGGETAQLYIGYPKAARSPSLQLKGFEKVFLDAGETRRVKIPFDEYSFRSYDTQSGAWVTVGGRYKIYIASSSYDLRLQAYIDKTGAASAAAPDTESLTPCAYPLIRDGKGATVADDRTPFYELQNARGAFGRLLSRAALYIVRNNKTVYGTMQYLPLRTLAQFGGFGRNRFEGLLMIFNGSFFRGLIKFFKKDNKRAGNNK